jgi:DNA-binding transcriptional ArsR family regulator
MEGSPDSYEKIRKEEIEDEETPVKTEKMKSNDSMEMLKFFDLLPEGARVEILKNLRRNAELNKDGEEDFAVDTKSTVEDYRSAMEGKSEREKASLYDD